MVKTPNLDAAIENIYNLFVTAVDKAPHNNYVVDIYFTIDNKEYEFAILDRDDKRYKDPIQMVLFHELGRMEKTVYKQGDYFRRFVIRHEHGKPADFLIEYNELIFDCILDYIATEYIKYHTDVRYDYENFVTEYEIESALEKLN